ALPVLRATVGARRRRCGKRKRGQTLQFNSVLKRRPLSLTFFRRRYCSISRSSIRSLRLPARAAARSRELDALQDLRSELVAAGCRDLQGSATESGLRAPTTTSSLVREYGRRPAGPA